MSKIHMYCIGHEATKFDVPEAYTHVSSNEFNWLNQLIIPDESMGANFHGRILSEYTQLFGLVEHIQHLDPEDYIYLFQYRKFVSLRPPTTVANIPGFFTCKADEAPNLFPSIQDLQSMKTSVLVGTCWNHEPQSMASFFSANHNIEDFCGLAASLALLNDFAPQRVRGFINCSMFFPSPALGMTTVAMFRDRMQLLRSAWSAYQEHFLQERTGYQRRVGGFLLERLHSFLVYESVFVHKTPATTQGYSTVISDSDFINPTI